MPSTITRVNDVEFELQIEAPPSELEPGLEKALKQQRTRATFKGFRPGKVPAHLVEKLYGKALAYGVADEYVQEMYKALVLDSDDYEVLGQPAITALDYEYRGTLTATVRFGVRPVFELADLAGVELSKLVYAVDEKAIDEEIERIRTREAELTVIDGVSDEHCLVLTDLQQLDAESGQPLIGEKREGVAFLLDSPDLPEDTRKALLGLKAGDSARVTLVRKADNVDVPFEATVTEVKRRDMPTLDDAFIEKFTKGETTTLAAFREELSNRMQRSIGATARELFEGDLVKAVLDRHDFAMPDSVIDLYAESRLEEFKKQAGDRLPKPFDEDGYRESARPEAARQARWMFIRDHVVKQFGFAATDEDRETFFAEIATSEGLSAEFMARYYRSVPRLMEQLDDRLVTKKVLDFFAAQVTVVEKDRETYAADRNHDHDHDHHHDHDHDHHHHSH